MLKSILVFFNENNFLFFIDNGFDKPLLTHKSFIDGVKSLIDTHFSYIEYDFFLKKVKFYLLNLSLFNVDLQLNITYQSIQVEKLDLFHLFKKFIGNQNYISIDNNNENYVYKVLDEQPLSFFLFEDLKLKKIRFYLLSKIKEYQPNFIEYQFDKELYLHAGNILKLCEFNYIIEYIFTLNNSDIEINCHVSNFDISNTHNFQNIVDEIKDIKRINNCETSLILSPYLNKIPGFRDVIGGDVFLLNDLMEIKFIRFVFEIFAKYYSEKFKYILFDLNKIICYNTKLNKKVFLYQEADNLNLPILVTKKYNNILNLNSELFTNEVTCYFTNLLDNNYRKNIEYYLKLLNITNKVKFNFNKINSRKHIDNKFGAILGEYEYMIFIEIQDKSIFFYGWNNLTNIEDIAEFKTNTLIKDLKELKMYLLKFCQKCKVLIFKSIFIVSESDFEYFYMISADILKNHSFLLVPLPNNYWEELLV